MHIVEISNFLINISYLMQYTGLNYSLLSMVITLAKLITKFIPSVGYAYIQHTNIKYA